MLFKSRRQRNLLHTQGCREHPSLMSLALFLGELHIGVLSLSFGAIILSEGTIPSSYLKSNSLTNGLLGVGTSAQHTPIFWSPCLSQASIFGFAPLSTSSRLAERPSPCYRRTGVVWRLLHTQARSQPF